MMTIKQSALLCLCLALLAPANTVFAAETQTPIQSARASGFVANKDSLQVLFNALSSKLGKPVILSQKVMRKQVSGEFDLDSPWGALTRLADQLGLIWYFDGQAVYVYDANELKNSVVSLRNIELKELTDFLSKNGLYDKRYPIRGNLGTGTFYVAGPPVYVDIVLNSAAYMDQHNSRQDLGSQKIAVIQLNNSFVSDRSYKLRDQTITVPGIATVIQNILRDGDERALKGVTQEAQPAPESPASVAGAAQSAGLGAKFNPSAPMPGFAARRSVQTEYDARISIQAFSETNSLLVKGRPDQIEFIQNLVRQLDVAKRHVELALWIIDVSKDAFEKLGVKWGGGVSAGPLKVELNPDLPITALDGSQFLAQINALQQKNQADVVTRPVVLTQENVPALFDHSQTFYAQLTAERVASLEKVTYGTMISVVPRLSGDAREIEMVLNIEDGNKDDAANNVNGMPLVRNTQISTVARVPKGRSLLVGGYALNDSKSMEQKIPLLGSIPLIGGAFRYRESSSNNRLRLFLIEPRVLENGSGWNAEDYDAAQNPDSASSVVRTLGKLRAYMDSHALN